MTAVEKTILARFLDLTADYLRDGHVRELTPDGCFEDDDSQLQPAPAKTADGESLPAGLPLAYMIDEDEEHSGESNEPGVSAESVQSDDSLAQVAAEIAACQACALATARKNAVPGEGALRPLVMVIGEGPGADEDAAGRPFVGKAGQLLDKMLASINLFRDKNCYIANMVKCRPPGNRDPDPKEIAACLPYLERQITQLQPLLILCAGRVAAQNLLKTGRSISSLRGEFAEYMYPAADYKTIPVLCTFHPSAILRDESLKRPAWEDLKLLRSRLVSLDADYAVL